MKIDEEKYRKAIDDIYSTFNEGKPMNIIARDAIVGYFSTTIKVKVSEIEALTNKHANIKR